MDEKTEQDFFVAFAQTWRTNYRPEAARLQAQTHPDPAQWRVNGPVLGQSGLRQGVFVQDGRGHGAGEPLHHLVDAALARARPLLARGRGAQVRKKHESRGGPRGGRRNRLGRGGGAPGAARPRLGHSLRARARIPGGRHGAGRFLLRVFLSMWVHEVGHAAAAWVSRVPRIPGSVVHAGGAVALRALCAAGLRGGRGRRRLGLAQRPARRVSRPGGGSAPSSSSAPPSCPPRTRAS